MKPFNRILLLTGLVSAIVGVWLIPGISTADYSHYERVYEDTSEETYLDRSTDTLTIVMPPVAEKKMVKQVTEAKSIEDIDPEMFSRAIHFEPVVEDVLVYANGDTVKTIEVAKMVETIDSVEVVGVMDSVETGGMRRWFK